MLIIIDPNFVFKRFTPSVLHCPYFLSLKLYFKALRGKKKKVVIPGDNVFLSIWTISQGEQSSCEGTLYVVTSVCNIHKYGPDPRIC